MSTCEILRFMEPTSDAWPERLPDDVTAAFEGAFDSGVPSRSVAAYARWWSLETWLRALAYVELRSQRGQHWTDVLDRRALQRQSKEQARVYMASPDWMDPLAYLDAGPLFELVDRNWPLFEPSLISESSWRGRREELLQIRNRIGHLRRPHRDDLGRLEQTLRDLEHGAVKALRAYNRRRRPDCDCTSDPVVAGWIVGEHPTARRLLAHAERQYGISLELTYSIRPWASKPIGQLISGSSGVLWHARFYVGSRYLRLREFWRDDRLDLRTRRLLVHVLADDPHQVELTFAAVDEPHEVGDAIGDAFDAVLANSSRRSLPGWDDPTVEALRLPRPDDARVLVGSPWNIVDDDTEPVTIFGA